MPYENFSYPTSESGDDGGLFTISVEAYDNFAFISNMIATPIICVFGLLGNILGLGVLWKDRKQHRLTIYVYLCALTLFDIVYLIVGLIRSVPNVINIYDKQLANYIEEHMKLGSVYIDIVLSLTSTAIIIVMSFERLMALLRPFTVKHFWISKYPKTIIVVCFLFNAIFLIPFPLYFEVGSYVANNVTVYYLQFQEDAVATMDTYMYAQTFVDYFFPACCVIVTNIAIPIVYSRAMTRRQAMINVTSQGLNNNQAKITMAVFCITLMYFLLSLPNLFIKLMAFIDKEYSFDGKYKLSFWLFIDISNLFNYINAANDFVIYILVSNHYRQVFTSMYCRICCYPRRRQHNVDSSDDSNTVDLHRRF